MLDKARLDEIKRLTEEFWVEHVKTDAFRAIFVGKEIGHKIADYVDEKTTELLKSKFDCAQQVDKKGKPRSRSMGDVWIAGSNIYNPLNVKAGEAGKNGQPNLVSLTKLIDALLSDQIDSYYLLIVKMRMVDHSASEDVQEEDLSPELITPNVYLVDMLDYLDFVTFDSGPGQAMLKEKQFYAAVDAGQVPKEIDLPEKVKRLMALMEDGDRRLAENRATKMTRLRKLIEDYEKQEDHTVNQEGLELG